MESWHTSLVKLAQKDNKNGLQAKKINKIRQVYTNLSTKLEKLAKKVNQIDKLAQKGH